MTHLFEFKALANNRADFLYGRTVDGEDRLVIAAKNRLVAMPKRDLRVNAPVPWEQLPQMGVNSRRDAFAGMGYGGRPDAAPSAEANPAKI